MSCEFQLTATIEGIIKFLDRGKSDHIDTECDDARKTLQSFEIALSPTGELVVFAKSTWLLICRSKWDPSIKDCAKIKYSPTWHGHINSKPGEEITSIFCLPFISEGQSSLGYADWTCIILGFSTGWIRFYTEGMQELACSIFHEERITNIKSFAPTSMQLGKNQKQENAEIYVLYKSVLCILNKTQLMQSLYHKRRELAKGFFSKRNETENYLPVDFKKYSFVGQEDVTDACFLGQTPASSFNTFDHLVTASLIGGFHSNYRASPPQTSLIVTSGRRPFVGFHYTLEGANSPVLTDVALAVASKIKNSVTATLPDWLGFGSKKSTRSEKPKEVSQEYAERLNCRFGLCDLWRQGQSIIVSPDGLYSAVTDSLGRVILIDNTSGLAHRLWKGYRDAQCGFLQVQEDVKKLRKSKENKNNLSPQPRQGLFIVIYGPKKGLIEIFTTQHGRRVTSFKVTKYGQLLYTPGTVSGQSINAGAFNFGQNQVIFISEEGFNEFSIPFHCALVEDNSKISRDLHVLKKMKMLFKVRNSNNSKFIEEIEKWASELKTDEVRLQAIESMITYKGVTLEAFKCVLKVFLPALESKERPEPASKKIIRFAQVTFDLIQLYEFLISLQNFVPNSRNSEIETKNSCSLSEELNLPQNELDILLKVIQQITEIEKVKQQTTKVAFDEKKSAKLIHYLACFDFESFLSILEKNEKQEEKKENYKYTLNLKSSGKEKNFCYLGEIFFDGIFNSPASFDQWKKYVAKCCLNPQNLAVCLISYWCSKDIIDDVFPEVLFFIEVVKFICSLNDSDLVIEYNVETPWWEKLRHFIAENSFTIRGLFAALCCRSVTIFIEQEREFSLRNVTDKKIGVKVSDGSSNNETSIFNNDWETISKDTCQWDILIVQLQDVALLNAVISLTFDSQNCPTEIPFDFERQSLTSIQLNGTGRVSELVAKWLVQFGFEPTILIDKNDLEFQASGEEREIETDVSELSFALDKANESRTSCESLNALEYLVLLKNRFPYSLTSSSLLSNMCWEYFAHWFKNVSDVLYLEAAIQYLEAIPSCRVKYGISYLSWNTYLAQKFETLVKMINRIGKVPRDKLCVQEIGLRNDQVPVFLKLITKVLRIMFQTDEDEKPDFRTNREAIWQSNSTPTTSSLVSIVMSQPLADSDFILFQLQLAVSLLMMSSLNIKYQRVLSILFDNVELSNFTHSRTLPLSSHYKNLKLKDSRIEFLKKCLSGAVQTVAIVEYVPPISSHESSDIVPTTKLEIKSYTKWLQLCFELAGMWTIPLDDLRKHQICELYCNGFDRLAEEVIPSVSDTTILASQLLVLGGKRLKYLIQDSNNFSKKLTKLSANLSEWLYTLDLENFSYHGTTDDIEVLMRYVAKWLPEDHSDQKLAIAVIESLSFFKTKTIEEFCGNMS